MKTKSLIIVCLSSVLILAMVVVVYVLRGHHTNPSVGPLPTRPSTEAQTEEPTEDPFLSSSAIAVSFLPVNEYSRPGTELKNIKGIVIHYVGNPGTTAAQNRSYFANLAETKEAYASSHYVVGLQGEIIQCIPLTEIAYASNDRNWDTIAIECCHPGEDGQFNPATYDALIRLCAALCKTYGLNPETDVLRHFDITGKQCPMYYALRENAWFDLKLDIRNHMQ